MTPAKHARLTLLSGILLLLFIYPSGDIYAQEAQVSRQTISWTPPENGYELQIPFAWKFINCYGEVHVTITKNTKDVTSSAYIYEGVRYTAAELGADAFEKPSIGLTDLSADVYHNSFRLGRIKMGNVIDWLGGCFGQTYYVTKMLGVSDADYKDKVAELSLSALRIETCSSRDYGLEGRIKEMANQKELNSKMSEAEAAFARGDLEEAKRLYKEAQKLDYGNEHIKARLAEITEKEKAEKNEQLFNEQLSKAEELEEQGDLRGAKSAYEAAQRMKPEDESIRVKITELEEKLGEQAQAARDKQEAKQAAGSRSHSGFFWGRNFGSDAHGTSVQNSNLIGNFRLDYKIWSIAGEPAHQFRFYWEWADALNTGYPQYVSVLSDTVVMIREIEKYPDLMARWNSIRPQYIEVESDILYYKNGEDYVADEGTIKVIPAVIGRSGQIVDWELPSSSNWDELFTYCNHMKWRYFDELGLREEIDEYEDKFGNDIAWAKYAFEYSNEINFFLGHSWFSSEFRELSNADYENWSSSAEITKIVWPVEEIHAVIREFEEREKRGKEENMSSEDFWNTPENEKSSETASFWDTPENSTTQQEAQTARLTREFTQLMNEWSDIFKQRKEKYAALQNPFTISSPANNSRHEKNVVEVSGSINKYFRKYSNEVFLYLNGVKQQVDVNSSGQFSNPMVLSNGNNEIKLELAGNGFTLFNSMNVIYDGVDTDIRATLTWNTSGSDLDLYMRDPSGSTCSYRNKSAGKMSLDVDDTNGYGPENISLVDGGSGSYRISVRNYSGGQGAEATVYIYVDEELQEVKTHRFTRSSEEWEVATVYFNN